MDPDNQFQDPNDNNMEEMLMNPDDQMDQPDDLQTNPLEQDIDQNEDAILQRSINIQDETNNVDEYNEEQPMFDDGNGDGNIQFDGNEDDFIPDDQISPEDDGDENSMSQPTEKIKALSEKEEDQISPLEETTNNIAMSLLPQSAIDENQEINEDKSNNFNEVENTKDEDQTINEIEKSDENQRPDEDQIMNQNENINDKEIENQETPIQNSIEETKDDQQAIDQEKEMQDIPDKVDNNETEGCPSEEGMEVKDNMTPQRATRQRRLFTPITPIESLSKLPPLQTDPDLDAENLRLLNNFKKKGRLPDITQRTQLVQYIQREKVNNVVAQRFGKAQELQDLLQKYQKAIVDQEIKERNRDKIENLKASLDSTKEELKKNDKEIKYKIEDEKEKQKEHYYVLLQRQDEELNTFERKWNDPNFIQKYAKPSSTLLSMKNVERSMVLTKMFDRAEIVHNKVKELEKVESRQAQEVAENEMEREKQKILSRQASEIQAYELHCTRQIEIIERNHESSRLKTKGKIAKLEAEILELEKNPPTSLPPMSSPATELKLQTVMTPRTSKRYSMYKTQPKKPVLTLNPLKNVRPSKKSRRKTVSSLT